MAVGTKCDVETENGQAVTGNDINQRCCDPCRPLCCAPTKAVRGSEAPAACMQQRECERKPDDNAVCCSATAASSASIANIDRSLLTSSLNQNRIALNMFENETGVSIEE